MDICESLYKRILDEVNCRICVFDGNGTIVYCNDSFRNAYLSHFAEDRGITFREISSDEYKKISFLNEALRTDKRIARQMQYASETFSVTTHPFQDSDGSNLILETIQHSFEPVKGSLNDAEIPVQEMILTDDAMKTIVETIYRISQFDSTVLITGESGTGKSMLAKFIHENSRRCREPFVTINCATIPENLIESELFGYVSGAFTGASQKGKPGMIELADKGTLFLDEIGLLPLSLQSKFLQLIQEKTYTPIGALKSKTVDIRIISATNLDLRAQIDEKKFREDLYYRLRVIELHMPPLRERPDAAEPLIAYFIKQFNKKYSMEKTISQQAIEILKQHHWTGNIRELQYVLERLFVTSPDNQITTDDLPPLSSQLSVCPRERLQKEMNFDAEVEQYEQSLLQKAFNEYKSSYKIAAALGMTQTRASRLLRKYGIK
jgi:TyrR family helix-turn-helix protein